MLRDFLQVVWSIAPFNEHLLAAERLRKDNSLHHCCLPSISMQVSGDFIAKNSLAQRTHARAWHKLLWHAFGKRKSGGRNEKKRAKSHVSIARDPKHCETALKTSTLMRIRNLVPMATR